MWTESSRGTPRRRKGEEGSAYLAVLLVLVVLTIFALALSLITQTEVQMGANERTISRVFYGADAGIEAAIAKALATSDFGARTYLYTDSGLQLAPSTDGKPAFAARVDVSLLYPIQEAPCNLCEINQAGAYGGKDYYKMTHIVTATATRFGTMDGGAERVPVAQKTISAMVEMQPFESSMESFKVLDDPDALSQIKF